MDYVNLKDSYKLYEERNSEANRVDGKTYLNIIYGFMKFQMQKIIEGYEVNLGAGSSLGTLYIIGTKVKPRLNEEGEIRGLAPDWRKTRDLWNKNPEAKEKKEIVYCFNEHSNGIRYKIAWVRRQVKLKNNEIYELVFTKGPNGNKRKVARSIRAGTEYKVKTQ